MLLPKIKQKISSKLLLTILLLLSFAIRIWNINNTPPALYWDEMDIGYQAYSILKTGKDYFGEFSLLTVHSFSDYHAPLIIYLTIPSVAIFGLTAFAVRLPAAILGTITVFLIYFLTGQLFKNKRISFTAAILTAFAPWAIQYSRIAFEISLVLPLFLAGLLCFFQGLKNPKWHLGTSIFFSLSLFAYNTMKLFIPLMILCLITAYYSNAVVQAFSLWRKLFRAQSKDTAKQLNKRYHMRVVSHFRKLTFNKYLLISVIIFAISFAASLYSAYSLNGGQRFSEISVFTDPQISWQVNFLRNQSQSAYKNLVSLGESPRLLDKGIYNKITLLIDNITKNYLEAFSSTFLFVRGDPNPRHSASVTGEFYRIEVLSILLGSVFLLTTLKKNKNSLLLILWILIAPLPSIITRDGGNHATRLFLLFPVLSITSALGVNFIPKLFNKKVSFVILAGVITVWIFCLSAHLNFYFGSYKLESAKAFQYGFKEAAEIAEKNKNNYEYVIIDDKTDSALMNYLFLTGYDPSKFQSLVKSDKLTSDISGFIGDQIDNVLLMRPKTKGWDNGFTINRFDKNYLLIVTPEQMNEETPEKLPRKFTKNQKLLDIIYYKTGSPAFYIIESKKPNQNENI